MMNMTIKIQFLWRFSYLGTNMAFTLKVKMLRGTAVAVVSLYMSCCWCLCEVFAYVNCIVGICMCYCFCVCAAVFKI